MDDYGEEYFHKIYDASGEGSIISKIRARMLVDKFPAVKKVLDIGCGFGDFLYEIERSKIKATGIDISSYALSKAVKKLSGKLIKLDVGKKKLPFKRGSFDAVTIFDVVEHLESADLIFSEIFRILKEGGLVLATTPNHQGWLRGVTTRIFPDDPTHVNVQNGEYWTERLIKSGFSEIEVKHCILHGFPPLPGVRKLMSRVRIPIYLGPIFFPVPILSGTLYISGTKKDVRRTSELGV